MLFCIKPDYPNINFLLIWISNILLQNSVGKYILGKFVLENTVT